MLTKCFYMFYTDLRIQSRSTKAFQNLSLTYHHCPAFSQGQIQRKHLLKMSGMCMPLWLVVKSALINFVIQTSFQDLFPLNYSNLKQRPTKNANFCSPVPWRALSNRICITDNIAPDGFGGLVVSMLASGTQLCGFKPGQSH